MGSNTPRADQRGAQRKRKPPLTLRETVLFSLFGAILFGCKFFLEGIPNVHPLALFIVALTLVYRSKALYPIYVFVLLDGVREGFAAWWIPYLYVFLPLWAAGMLMPRGQSLKSGLPRKLAMPILMLACGLQGLAFGTMMAPVMAWSMHLGFKGMLAWIVAGLSFDAMHAVNNIAFGALILPLADLIRRLEKVRY